jgi:hypothetical protein
MADPTNQDQNHVFPEPQEAKQGGYIPRVVAPPQEPVQAVVLPEQYQYQQPQVPQYQNPNQQQAPQYQQSPQVQPQQNQYYQNVQQSIEQNPYFQVADQNQQLSQQPQILEAIKKPKFAGFGKIQAFLKAKWWLVLGIVAALILSGVGFFAYQYSKQGVKSDYTGVQARVEAPQTAPSGTPNRWKVVIQNTEKVSIQQIEVNLNFDRAFRYSKPINPDPADPKGNLYKLASLQAPGQGTSDAILSFEGILTGSIDEETLLSGEVSYVPTPLIGKANSRRTVSIQGAKTRITAPEIKVEMIPVSQEVQNGTEAEISVFFENLSERELKDVRIRMIYPGKGSFTYSSSEITLTTTGDTKTKPDDGNDTWFITNLPRLKKQQLKIRGTLSGADGVRQNFGVEIGIKSNDGYQTLQSTSKDIKIISQPIVISTQLQGRDVNRTFASGENLTFEVAYQNKSTTTLKAVEIFASVEDPAEVLDYSTLQYVGGVEGNINNRVIQWSGRGVPQLENLAPQVKGTLLFTVKVKPVDQFIKSGLSQTAFTLRPSVEAKAQNLPQIKATGEQYKGRSDIVIEQTVTEDPAGATAQNKKVYDVTLSIKTNQNKVNDVSFETNTLLPPSSWNQASVSPAVFADKISYNQQNGKISWKVGAVSGYTGLTNPIVSVSFKLAVEVAPGKGFAGIEALSEGKLTGVDDFTGEKYDRSVPKVVLTR